MRVRFQGPLATYELLHWSEREAGEESEHFADVHAARHLLRGLLETGARSGLRSLVERSASERGGFGMRSLELGSLARDELLDRAADALHRGLIVALREPQSIMVSHPPLVLTPPPAPFEPHEIEELGSVFMTPTAGAESLSLSVSSEPEMLGLETSHHAP